MLTVPSDFNDLTFDEELVTVSETGKELGEFKITISSVKKGSHDCYLVHANSHGIIDGVPCGTSITAYITKTLDTLEQQHHEYVKVSLTRTCTTKQALILYHYCWCYK